MVLTQEQRIGSVYSGMMHLAILLLAVFGLPHLFHMHKEVEPTVISVEILPVGPVTNIQPAAKPAEEKKEELQKELAKPVPKTKVEETPKEPERVTDKKVPLPQQKPKPEDKPKEKKKQEPDDLEAILKSVKQNAKTSKDTKATEATDATNTPKNNSEKYNPTLPLTMTERDAIRSQIERNWNPPIGAKDAYELKVVLRIALQQDGSVLKVDEVRGDAGGDPVLYRAAVESAIRAVWLSSPLKNLPAEKFDTWKDIELTFDPRNALY